MMNKRIFYCVLLGAALCPAFVSGFGRASAKAADSPRPRAEQSIPGVFGMMGRAIRDGVPGVIRPVAGAASKDAREAAGTVRVRQSRRAQENNQSVAGRENRPVLAAVGSAGPVADRFEQETDVPEIPELPAAEAEYAAQQQQPEDAPDASDAEIPGVEGPSDTEPLDMGGDENAPDAAVEIPEGGVSDDDRVSVSETQKPNEETPVTANTGSLGAKSWRYENAEKAVEEMTNDLLANLGRVQGGNELYERWRSYNASIRRRTNSLQTGNELNSRCRLSWWERLYQDPLRSVAEAEKASHLLGQCFMGSSEDVVAGVRYARFLTDVPVRQNRIERKGAENATEAIDMLKAALVEAAAHHAKALAPMGQNDLTAVSKEAHKIFCEQVTGGHTVEMRGRAMYLIDAMEKINKSELYDAGEAILSVLNEKTLDALRQIDFDALEKVRIGGDQIVGKISCEAGDILIGDRNRTNWELDSYPNACCIIDLGGDDVWREGSCVLNRPLLVVIDLGKGNDEYVGKNVAIQGGAILGVSVWYDDGGNDSYLAKDVCQGSAIGGFGVLINEEGDDHYLGFLREQGTSICGFGLLIDRGGNDDYRGALFAQGVGGPGGFGAIVDRDGNDHYYVGGYYFDSYPEHPGYDGWGQGIGAGIRRVACGGVGVLLDGGGDDAYEYDYFGHGGGYWMGVGIARDFGGNDVRYAATSTRYDGSPRGERRWTRFTNGFGCHYSVGYCFDDYGDDVYGGTIMGTGMGWDLSAGFCIDFSGNDVFEANGGLTQGVGAEGSIGVLMSYRGNDSYQSSYVGYSNNQLSYHSPSNCGANFSFVVDHGGRDQYAGVDNYRRPVQNNMVTQRGNPTGMIIDRPAPGEDQSNEANATTRAPITLDKGYPRNPSHVKTMAAAPPLYDTTPHATSNGKNAFNDSPSDIPSTGGGGWFGGGRIFGRGIL